MHLGGVGGSASRSAGWGGSSVGAAMRALASSVASSKANGFGSEPKPNRGSSVFLENPLDPNPRFQRFPREPVGSEPAVPALFSRTRWIRTRGSSAFFRVMEPVELQAASSQHHDVTACGIDMCGICVPPTRAPPGRFCREPSERSSKSAPFLCFVGVPLRYHLAICVSLRCIAHALEDP